jgi:hypothetical protein
MENHAGGDSRVGRIRSPNQAATAIRDRFQKYQAWRTRLNEQARQQPACYSLIAVQRATAVAKWLAGLSGAGTVLAFGFYLQSYLSILSIKNDCASLRFVADANGAAVECVRLFLVSGMLALLAIAWPTAVGIGRNLLRWMRADKLPPLQPGHEFNGWSEFQVTGRVTILQYFMLFFSCLLFFGVTFALAFSAVKPEGVLTEWHHFELQCLPQPPDQGAS